VDNLLNGALNLNVCIYVYMYMYIYISPYICTYVFMYDGAFIWTPLSAYYYPSQFCKSKHFSSFHYCYIKTRAKGKRSKRSWKYTFYHAYIRFKINNLNLLKLSAAKQHTRVLGVGKILENHLIKNFQKSKTLFRKGIKRGSPSWFSL